MKAEQSIYCGEIEASMMIREYSISLLLIQLIDLPFYYFLSIISLIVYRMCACLYALVFPKYKNTFQWVIKLLSTEVTNIQGPGLTR